MVYKKESEIPVQRLSWQDNETDLQIRSDMIKELWVVFFTFLNGHADWIDPLSDSRTSN